MPKRKYVEQYIDFGFTYVEKGGEQLPQCVLCHKTLSNDSMKPHQLKQHLTKVHSECAGKTRNYFEAKAKNLKKMRMDTDGAFQAQSRSVVEASFEVALLIAKTKKPHNIAENLIKPCLVTCAKLLLGDSAASQMKQVSLSNDTVRSRICEMSDDLQRQLIHKVKSSPVFSIQLDESVDVVSISQLLVFVRYIGDTSIEEDILFCKPLQATTTAADVMEVVDSFFVEHSLQWEKLVSVCTDGAPAMLGARSGFIKRVKEKNPNTTGMHCIIHREALASRTMPRPLKNVLDTAIKLVNYVKSSALNTRLFRNLCEDLHSENSSLLFHTAVRWLSKGKMLNRLMKLLPEVIQFLQLRGEEKLLAAAAQSDFQDRLAYLSDFFAHLNELNSKLQGPDCNILGHMDKINAFIAKLEFWSHKFEQESDLASSFPSVATHGVDAPLRAEVVSHLSNVISEFKRYFPNYDTATPIMALTRNPFRVSMDDVSSELQELEEEFIEMVNDSSTKDSFADLSLSKFWVSTLQTYPGIAGKALTLLVAFPSTYLCESAFSTVVTIKSKARNRLLDLDADLRCAITKLQPNIKEIIKKRQSQISH